MLCRAIRTATHWGGSRRGRPLHALACTRRLRTVAKSFTQFQEMPWHARAPLQLNHWNRGARGRRDFRNTGPRAAARPEPLAVPSTHWARRRPAAPAVGPRRRSRPAARALDRFATKMPAQTPSGARVAALQQARPASRPTAPPQSARSHTRCCMLGAPRAAHIEKSGPPARTAREASWPGANWWFLSY